ncbi:UDP-glycosyltransferase 87A1-like [Magnolia sinica]|uniref:UDP-glycosyltransferase 87A1-like n=1 Tax=Magnolia sinica TaxID=86752 RepID=UPI00265A862F|nr:UDP-glycosyltransferase 87A1-like [Magnolia sinica]
MDVCQLLSSNQDLIKTFVVTEEWLGFIGSAPKPSNIRLRSIPNVIPSERARGKDMASFVEAVYTKMADPFDQLLDQLDQPISWIITDTYLTWVVEIGNRRNIPVASLWTMSSAVFSILYHNDLIMSNLHLTADDDLSGIKFILALNCLVLHPQKTIADHSVRKPLGLQFYLVLQLQIFSGVSSGIFSGVSPQKGVSSD